MKKEIHPTYYPRAEVHCACGHKFYVGSTKPKIETEVCSRCHPFYSGAEKIIDTAGLVKKFEARRRKSEELKKKASTKKQKKEKK
jgi:large subunit ribosomal protein L31